MFTKIFRRTHQVLGLLLSVLFLMWFASGFVMIYHSFPKADQKRLLARQALLPEQLSAADTLWSILPDSSRLTGLSVEMYLDRPVFRLQGKQLPAGIYADSLQFLPRPGFSEIHRLAVQLCGSVSCRVDTLHRLDQWIPFGSLTRELPVYKFSFTDSERQQVYISSRSGRVLQWTDVRSRFWTWLGAIPHWVYFTSLRQHQSLWLNFMIWASGLGAIMCFTGWWIGIRVFWKNRRKGFRSPYKRWWLRWHHISGVVFGLFALTFVFSGMMSLTDLPAWMQKRKSNTRTVHFRGREGRLLSPDRYALDYRKIIREVPGVKNITWASFGSYPYYIVNTSHGKRYIDAGDSSQVTSFRLSEEMIRNTIRGLHGADTRYTLERITDWDNDYYSRRGMLTLPVYKVKIDDELHTCHYFNPETLYHRQTDDNTRLRGILYNGLHSLNFKFLSGHPFWWNALMYLLLTGGTFLSLSGLVLTLQWLRRMFSRMRKKYRTETYFNTLSR